MAGKGKFKIPTGEEMEKSTSNSPSISTMSLFQNYRDQKKNPTNTEQTSRKHSSTGNLEEKPSKSSSSSVRPNALTNSHQTCNKIVATGSVVQKSGAVANGIASKSSFSGTKPMVGEKVNTVAPSSKAFGSKPASAPGSAKDKKTISDTSMGKESSESSTAGTSKAPSINSIIVNYRQRGNPILKHVRNVPWEYGSIVPDYVMGKANCALFLSLRYHQLNPTYIHNRLKELGKGYDLRVILVQVDVTDPHHLLKDLAKICILADCTLMVAFSVEEAGRYLETYKVYENKPPEALMEKTDTDYVSKLTDTLTTVKSVNKTDCMTLLSTFGSFEEIVKATKEDLSLCPGFGPQKAQRLYDVLHESFVKGRKRHKEEPTAKEPSPSTSAQHSPAKKPS